MHKKRVSCLYRTATTKHPCCIPTLGDSMGAGRIRLTQLQKYNFFLNYKVFFYFFETLLLYYSTIALCINFVFSGLRLSEGVDVFLYFSESIFVC